MRLADWVMDWLDELSSAVARTGETEHPGPEFQWLLGELRARLGEVSFPYARGAPGPEAPAEPDD
jgi:hypothetical protein